MHKRFALFSSTNMFLCSPVYKINLKKLLTKVLLFQHGLFTTLHKYYSVDEWKQFAVENPDVLPNVAASSGTGESDFERLTQVLQAVPELSFVCLDVANGYSQHFVEYLRKVRSAFPSHTIIVSNTYLLQLSLSNSFLSFSKNYIKKSN